MDEHVRVQRADEEQGARSRVVRAQDAGVGGAAEVVGEDAQSATRRAVPALRVERHLERGAMEGDDEMRGNDRPRERNELLGHAAEHDARIGRGVDARQLLDDRREAHLLAGGHALGEQTLLRRNVAKDRGRRHAERRGDVGKRRRFEAPGEKNPARGLEELVSRDAGATAHL